MHAACISQVLCACQQQYAPIRYDRTLQLNSNPLTWQEAPAHGGRWHASAAYSKLKSG